VLLAQIFQKLKSLVLVMKEYSVSGTGLAEDLVSVLLLEFYLFPYFTGIKMSKTFYMDSNLWMNISVKLKMSQKTCQFCLL
jgi:hypothetical protein